MHQEPPARAPVDVLRLRPQIQVRLVGDLVQNPGRHHQAVVAVKHPGRRFDLRGKWNPRLGAVSVLEVPQQRLLPLRVELDPPAAQQSLEPTHVASFQQSRPEPWQCYASDVPRVPQG
ncbi:hypothetical protein GCM10009848_20920 [Micromonospora lupini]